MYIYILELVGYVLDHYGCPDLHIHLWIVKLQTRLAAGRRRVPRPPSHVNALLLLLLTHLCSSSSEWDAMREVSSQVITNVVIEARWEWLRMTLVVTVVVVGRGRRRRRVVLKRRSSRVEHHERRDFFFFWADGWEWRTEKRRRRYYCIACIPYWYRFRGPITLSCKLQVQRSERVGVCRGDDYICRAAFNARGRHCKLVIFAERTCTPCGRRMSFHSTVAYQPFSRFYAPDGNWQWGRQPGPGASTGL